MGKLVLTPSGLKKELRVNLFTSAKENISSVCCGHCADPRALWTWALWCPLRIRRATKLEHWTSLLWRKPLWWPARENSLQAKMWYQNLASFVEFSSFSTYSPLNFCLWNDWMVSFINNSSCFGKGQGVCRNTQCQAPLLYVMQVRGCIIRRSNLSGKFKGLVFSDMAVIHVHWFNLWSLYV